MTTTNELAFNTRRLYTNAGQRIGAVIIDTDTSKGFDVHTVAFIDIDRGIDGIMTVTRLTEDQVMAAYDYNRYRYATFGVERDAVKRAREVAASAPTI